MNGLNYLDIGIRKKSYNDERTTDSFRSVDEKKKYYRYLILFIFLTGLFTYGLMVYNNPVPKSSPSFRIVVKRRLVAVIAMGIAAVCQTLATVAFQSITNNRIITPSLLGFEALYTTINTGTIFLFGASSFIGFSGVGSFLFQISAMVIMCLILYGWLLSGKYGDLQLMLLVGVIIGTGLKSLSSFMKKLLAPSEFDILQAKLFGSVNNADASFFPIAIPLVIIAGSLLILYAKKLNILSLGKDVSISLGIDNKKGTIYTLVLVAILMSVSTALVGPLTFFGFLAASITYQLTPSYDHRYIFPMSIVVGFLILTSSYFLMYHVFNAQGVVSVIIEMFGGIAFLTMILRKGTI